MKRLNELITEARKMYKISRKGVANISGFNERTIGAYERGELTIPSKYLSFISIYFNINLECFEKGYVSDIAYTDNNKKYGEKYDKCNMDKRRLVIERYKAIHNLTSEEIINKIGFFISYGKFEEYFENRSICTSIHEDKKTSDLGYYVEICKKLKIKPSSFGFNLSYDKEYMVHEKIDSYNKYLYYTTIEDKEKEKYKVLVKQEEKDKKELLKCENKKDFILYDEDYYISIIKARNNPNNVYIPTEKEILPQKHKEILELLPFAPDSFIDTIIEKLRTIKDTQSL